MCQRLEFTFDGVPAVELNWIAFTLSLGQVYGSDNTFYVEFRPPITAVIPSIGLTPMVSLVGIPSVSSSQGFSFSATTGGPVIVSFEVFSATNDLGEGVYFNPMPSSSDIAFFVPELDTNGDFATGDFSSWTLSGDTSFAYVDDGAQSGIAPLSGNFEAALGTSGSRGYLSRNSAHDPWEDVSALVLAG